MGSIRVLPDLLVNKIAAGEVVERPASVVKELLENALDAGAGRITVELEAGGRSSILVEDDGCGMDGDDLLMALERHATSKLSSDGDLAAIATLGFRGEALPSIASVSKLQVSSRPAGSREGHRVSVAGGRFLESTPCGLFEGTRIEVRSLFYNVPARRKFLRTPATELSHVILLMEHYALARPDVAFALKNGERSILQLAPARDRVERFFELFPDLPEEDFHPVLLDTPACRVEGLASKPDRNFSSAKYQFTLVNGRFIRDRLIQHAISEAYENTHPRGRYPVVLLALTLPFNKVDVNVHPAKREVRFVEGRAVHGAVARALVSSISPGRASTPGREGYPNLPAAAALSSVKEGTPLFEGGTPTPPRPAPPEGSQARLPVAASPLKALAQWRSSFILCDSPEGLAIVDQHVAHERLRFEQFRRFLETPGARQPFLVPPVFTLPRALEPRTGEMAELLTAQGFEAEPIGEGRVGVRSAPAFLTPGEAEALLGEIMDSPEEVIKTPRDRWKEILVMRSCRGSVMARDPLTREQMQALLDDLFALGAPLTCPHGRPIVFTLGEREILANFDR